MKSSIRGSAEMNSPCRSTDSRVPNQIQKSPHSSKSSSLVWLELVHFWDLGRLTLQGETEISWHHLKEFQVSGDSIDIFSRALLKCTEQKQVHTHTRLQRVCSIWSNIRMQITQCQCWKIKTWASLRNSLKTSQLSTGLQRSKELLKQAASPLKIQFTHHLLTL